MKSQGFLAAVWIAFMVSTIGCGGSLPRSSPTTIASYPLPLSSVSPVDTPTVSNPPTPRPGSPVAPFATIDSSKVTLAPTRTSIPDTPGLTLTPIIIPTQMPWNIVTPSASALTYTDPTFGFSFQYPENWQLEKPNGPNSPSLPEGTELTIRNYDAGLRKGPTPSDALTIQFTLSAEGDKYGSADNWLAEQKQRDVSTAAVKYSPEEHIMVGDTPALRFVATAPTVPAGNQLTVWTRGKWLYILSAVPASSTSIGVLSRIVGSFKFE